MLTSSRGDVGCKRGRGALSGLLGEQCDTCDDERPLPPPQPGSPLCRPLGGVTTIVLSGFSDTRHHQLCVVALALGARVLNQWSGSCTHLVVSNEDAHMVPCAQGEHSLASPPVTPPCTAVAASGRGWIVSENWLVECHRHTSFLREGSFLVGAQPAYHTWLRPTLGRAQYFIRTSPFARHADDVLFPLLRRSFFMSPRLCRLWEIPLGASRMGGPPDAPRGFEWPVDGCGARMRMLFQARLSDISSSDGVLPPNGWLLFFIGEGRYPDAEHFRVVRVEDVPQEAIVRHGGVGSFSHRCASVTFHSAWQLPDVDEPLLVQALEDAGLDQFQDLCGGENVDDPYGEYRALQRMVSVGKLHSGLGEGGSCEEEEDEDEGPGEAGDWMDTPHHLLGHNDSHQQGGTHVTDHLSDEHHLCLAQIFSHEQLEWSWGDHGRVLFGISRDDLREWRFENATLAFQCVCL